MKTEISKEDVKVTIGCQVPLILKETIKEKAKELKFSSMSQYIAHLIELGFNSDGSAPKETPEAEERIFSLTEVDLDNIETRVSKIMSSAEEKPKAEKTDNAEKDKNKKEASEPSITLFKLGQLLGFSTEMEDQFEAFKSIFNDPDLTQDKFMEEIVLEPQIEQLPGVSLSAQSTNLIVQYLEHLTTIPKQEAGIFSTEGIGSETKEVALINNIIVALKNARSFENQEEFESKFQELKTALTAEK